jgi:hypothetical protein
LPIAPAAPCVPAAGDPTAPSEGWSSSQPLPGERELGGLSRAHVDSVFRLKGCRGLCFDDRLAYAVAAVPDRSVLTSQIDFRR